MLVFLALFTLLLSINSAHAIPQTASCGNLSTAVTVQDKLDKKMFALKRIIMSAYGVQKIPGTMHDMQQALNTNREKIVSAIENNTDSALKNYNAQPLPTAQAKKLRLLLSSRFPHDAKLISSLHLYQAAISSPKGMGQHILLPQHNLPYYLNHPYTERQAYALFECMYEFNCVKLAHLYDQMALADYLAQHHTTKLSGGNERFLAVLYRHLQAYEAHFHTLVADRFLAECRIFHWQQDYKWLLENNWPIDNGAHLTREQLSILKHPANYIDGKPALEFTDLQSYIQPANPTYGQPKAIVIPLPILIERAQKILYTLHVKKQQHHNLLYSAHILRRTKTHEIIHAGLMSNKPL
jgi:hypothetical protein